MLVNEFSAVFLFLWNIYGHKLIYIKANRHSDQVQKIIKIYKRWQVYQNEIFNEILMNNFFQENKILYIFYYVKVVGLKAVL